MHLILKVIAHVTIGGQGDVVALPGHFWPLIVQLQATTGLWQSSPPATVHGKFPTAPRIYLDDDLTRQQMEGRRALESRRLQLKADGHKTWWRRDVLHWAGGDGVHSQSPSRP